MTDGGRDRTNAQNRRVFLPKHDAEAAWDELHRLLLEDPEPDETPTETAYGRYVRARLAAVVIRARTRSITPRRDPT